MRSIPLSFVFRGQRKYVQGSDVFNGMIGALQEIGAIGQFSSLKLTIHHFTDCQCLMLVTDSAENPAAPISPFATMKVAQASETVTAWLVETGQVVAQARPYDEQRIVDLCVVESNSVTIRDDSGFTPIEVAIAMNKHLHHDLYGTSSGKWVFTGIELTRPFRQEDAAQLAITHKHNFGNKFTKASVYSGGEMLGNIYFYLTAR